MIFRNHRNGLLVFFLSVSHAVCAQGYGAVDPLFNTIDDGFFGDGAIGPSGGPDMNSAEIMGMHQLADGRVILGGRFLSYKSERHRCLVRIMPDGRRDDSFQEPALEGFMVSAMITTGSGDLLVAVIGDPGSHKMYRMDVDGVVDSTFSVTTSSPVEAVCELPDGRVAIGGWFATVNGQAIAHFAVLLPSGALDATIAVGSGPNNSVGTLLSMPDGSIMLGGRFTSFNGEVRNGVAQLANDGTLLDLSIGDWEAVEVRTIVPDGQGGLFYGGSFTPVGSTIPRRLLRTEADGTMDDSWPVSEGILGSVNVINVVAADTVMIGGNFYQVDGRSMSGIARLDGEGRLDTTFADVLDDPESPLVNVVHPTANGGYRIGGRFRRAGGRFRTGCVEVDNTGQVVEEFCPGRGVGGLTRTIRQLADGRIAIGGDFHSYNDQPRPYFAVLLPDGTLDTSFPADIGLNNPVTEILQLPGGNVLLLGDFTLCHGIEVPGVVAIHSSGALVSDLQYADIVGTERIRTAAVLGDGSVVVSSAPNSGATSNNSRVRKWRPDGSLDTEFHSPTLLGRVHSIVPHVGGTLLVGGSLTQVNGHVVGRIVRLMDNGTRDPSFFTGVAAGSAPTVHTIVVRSDGHIVVGGYFNQMQSVVAHDIVCLRPDGSVDPAFVRTGTSGSYAYERSISTMKLLPDDRVVVVGRFNWFNDVPAMCMVVIGPDGALDPSFSIGTGPSSSVYHAIFDVVVDNVGDYIVTGSFERINGTPRHRIAKLAGGGGVGINELQVASTAGTYDQSLGLLTCADPNGGTVFDAHGRAIFSLSGHLPVSMGSAAPGAYVLRTADGKWIRFVCP